MAGRHKGVLRIAIEDWFETFAFGKVLSNWFKDFGEDQELQISQINDDLMELIRDQENMPEAIKKLANFQEGDDAQGGILSATGFAAQIGQSAAGGILQPVVNILNYAMDSVIGSARADVQTLWAAYRRGFLEEKYLFRTGKDLGWDKASIEIWGQLTERLMGAGDLLTLWKRKEISETELNKRLTEQAWPEKEIAELKNLSQIIPGVGDLINMTVREAFNPGIVKKFGYDQDFPELVVPYLEAQGMSREWAERFWWSHWSVPSVGQGFEMLHRLRPGTTDTPFVEADLQDLLKTLDIASYWRPRLTQVSYSPLTRVDVRRMHKMGILSPEEVKGAYLDAGYNDLNAERMRDFTISFNQEDIKTLSKDVVIRAFKKGLFSESEALAVLIQAGLPTDQAEFLLSIASFDMLEKETDLQVDLVHDLYLAGEIIKSQAHSDLNRLNLPNTQIERLLKEWELEKLKKVRLPSETELQQFYELDYISSEDYKSGLIDRNYKLETIDLYIRQADEKIAEKLQKQERELMEAKERLQLDLLASDYRKAQLDMSVQIAQEKSNIAELKVIAHTIEEEEVLEKIKYNISYIQLLIKNMQLEKAKLKLAEEEEEEKEE